MSKGFFNRPSDDNLKFYPSNYHPHTSKDTYLLDKRETGVQSCTSDLSYGVWENKMGWIAAFGTGGYPNEPPLLEGKTYFNFEWCLCILLAMQ